MKVKSLEKMKNYFELSEVGPISRRYFVMNGFDGVMVVLGIMIGAYVTENFNPFWILSAGLGASLAMGISGFYGAYVAEEAERAVELNKLERSMLKKLDGTILARANKFASFWAAFVNGLSSVIIPLIILLPQLLAILKFIDGLIAIYSSISISLITLFLLGVYIGRLSKRNLLISGFKILLAGLIMTFLSFLLKLG